MGGETDRGGALKEEGREWARSREAGRRRRREGTMARSQKKRAVGAIRFFEIENYSNGKFVEVTISKNP